MDEILQPYGFKIGDLIQSNTNFIVYKIISAMTISVLIKVVDTSKSRITAPICRYHTISPEFLSFCKKFEKPRPTWEV